MDNIQTILIFLAGAGAAYCGDKTLEYIASDSTTIGSYTFNTDAWFNASFFWK